MTTELEKEVKGLQIGFAALEARIVGVERAQKGLGASQQDVLVQLSELNLFVRNELQKIDKSISVHIIEEKDFRLKEHERLLAEKRLEDDRRKQEATERRTRREETDKTNKNNSLQIRLFGIGQLIAILLVFLSNWLK